MKKVSIIVPVYKVRDYINDCLRSVFNQTYSNIEVVIVNDKTPDDSMEVAQAMIDELKTRFEVVVVNHEINQGLSDARNSGIKISTGEYVYFLDSDDEITPDCIELLHDEFVRNPNLTSSSAGYVNVAINGESTNVLPCVTDVSNKEIIERLLSHELIIISCNRLINREFLIKNNLWFESKILYEDMLFTIQLIQNSLSNTYVQKTTYIYKRREEAITGSSVNMRHHTSRIYILRKLLNIINDYQSISKLYIDLFMFKEIANVIVGVIKCDVTSSKKEKIKVVKDYLMIYRSSKPNLKLILSDREKFKLLDKLRILKLMFTPIDIAYSLFNFTMYVEGGLKKIIQSVRPRK